MLRMGLSYMFGWMAYINFVTAFNIDTKNPYLYESKKDTYFGYSIAFNKELESLVVGAPFSNETNAGNKPWGSVFTCPYGKDAARTCDILPKLDTKPFGGEIKEKQMMGATVYSDNLRTLACAPRYKLKQSEEEIWLLGKCDVIYPLRMKSRNKVWQPCYNLIGNLHEFGYCEAGITARFINQGSVISGMPRAQLSKGILSYDAVVGQNTKFTNQFAMNTSDYLGYSVGSGTFSAGNTQAIVGGAPRANLLMGRVLLYKITSGGFPLLRDITDPSERPGSYFGSSLAVTNIDNDPNKLDDLVVGAPFYSSGQQPNEGAAYVYLHLADGLELKQKIYGDKERNACFGYSIGSVGDLNLDSNNDIVIGAPWGGKDGKGVVYVYYGTPNVHMPLILKQKLTPSMLGANGANLNGFGLSFAEYYPYGAEDEVLNDVDDNKYPDLGIGAYKSDSAVILRSRPVITILGTLAIFNNKLKSELKRIDLFNLDPNTVCTAPDGKKYKCIHVKVSFTITGVGIGNGGAAIKFTVDPDANQKASKRGFFMPTGTTERKSLYTDTVTVKDDKRVESVTVYLVNNTKDIVREMVVKLNWTIQDSGTCGSGNGICPVANQLVYQLSIKKIAYVKGCSSDGNDDCNTDLQLKLEKITERISSGITDVLKIKATIKNTGENAFLNKLHIIYPLGIQPNKVQIENYPGTVIWDPNVSLDKQNVYTMEVTLTNPINQNQVEVVFIEFGVGGLTSGTKEVTLSGNVVTESKEMKPDDNEATVSVDVVLVANLTITGNVVPEMVQWNADVTSTKTLGPLIVHTFLLQNGGPSDIDDGIVEIEFPETIDNKYVLNIVNFKVESSKKSTQPKLACDVGELNPIKLNDTGVVFSPQRDSNGTGSVRRRRRRGIDKPLGCGDPDVKCRKITCPPIQLKKSADVSIKITSTLVEDTFERYVKENRKLIVYGKFKSKTVSKPDKNPAKDDVEVALTVISPHATYKADSKPLAWWIILLCVLAALIIIGGLVAILYKKGFFTRNRPQEEEEQLKNGYEEEEEEE